MTLLLLAVTILVGTGVLALVTGRWSRVATGIAALGTVLAAIVGLGPALESLRGAPSISATVPWALPSGAVEVGLDPLTSFFLVPLLIMGALCAVYGFFYMRPYWTRRAAGPPAFFFNVMLASMVLVLLARGAVILLVAWEIMTLAAYVLVTFEHEQAEVRRAGWVYLIAGHVGVAFLVGFFLVLGRHAGGLEFSGVLRRIRPVARSPWSSSRWRPSASASRPASCRLHVWLPEAARRRSLSRVGADVRRAHQARPLRHPAHAHLLVAGVAGRGPILLSLGVIGGLLGISLALYQRDMKRALAYSSIENVGVMLIGLGLGWWAAQNGHPRIAALGLLRRPPAPLEPRAHEGAHVPRRRQRSPRRREQGPRAPRGPASPDAEDGNVDDPRMPSPSPACRR